MGLKEAAKRCARLGLDATSASMGAAGAAASMGFDIATLPMRATTDLILGSGTVDSVTGVVRELVGGTPSRRCWQGDDRAWIEVRGASDRAVVEAVLAAVRAHPGVRGAEVNVPLSRVMVSIGSDGPTAAQLCGVVADAEAAAAGAPSRERVPDLPGDGVVLLGRVAAVTANGTGLCVAIATRALGVPRLPGMFSAAVTVVDYQPRLRRLVEQHLGTVAADTVVGLAAAAAHTAAQAPASLAVDLLIQLVHAAEGRSGQRSWARWEPTLAAQAACLDDVVPAPRPRPRPPGPVERHGDRSGLAQVVGSLAIGAVTRSLPEAATAAAVAAPKA
ncbi:cation-translocating P-type ATPase, partial [Mycolicibacterium madagascariense]|nr:cation-translocating P-type ATPase [Mycolicibacterium madagascariense]